MTSAFPDKQLFLLDSCIVEYLLDIHMESAVKTQLDSWIGMESSLSVSEISYSELIDGAYKEKIHRIKLLLNSTPQFEVSQRVLTGAAILANVYRTYSNKTIGSSLQDKIIAATAFISNLLVITADVGDFPHPFFITVASENLKYRKNNKDQYICLAVLRPNITMLNHWFGKTK